MNKKDKIQEGQVELDGRNNYQPLDTPMIKNTSQTVQNPINELRRNNHIDDMATNWLS